MFSLPWEGSLVGIDCTNYDLLSSVSLSVCLSVCPSLPVHVSGSLSLVLCLLVSLSLSISFCLSLFLFLLSLSVCLSLYVCLSMSLCLSVCLSLSLSPCLSVCLSHHSPFLWDLFLLPGQSRSVGVRDTDYGGGPGDVTVLGDVWQWWIHPPPRSAGVHRGWWFVCEVQWGNLGRGTT